MRYAIAIVVEAEDADKAWEEMGQVAAGTYDEFTMQFLGDPAEIGYQDSYTSREAANAILAAMPEAGAMSTSDGLGPSPVKVAEYTVRMSAGRRGEGEHGWWIGLGENFAQWGPYRNMTERQAIEQAHKDAKLPSPFVDTL